MGKFLRLFFGCHADPNRSFFLKGKQFPICARCTGELCGIVFGIIISITLGVIPFKLCIILLLPLILDGTIQLKTNYESNNLLRLFTGILFGVGIVALLINFHIFMVNNIRIILTKYFGPPPYINLFKNF